MNRISKIWWLPLARRVVGWGLAGALLWALPLIVLWMSVIGGLLWWDSSHPLPPEDFGEGWLILMIAMFAVASNATLAILGAIVGATCGFCASPNEAKNPLRSRFSRCVHAQTFWFWLVTSIVGVTVCSTIVFSISAPLLYQNFNLTVSCGLAFSGLLFALALWRGINGARKVKLSP